MNIAFTTVLLVILMTIPTGHLVAQDTGIWLRFEKEFTSDKDYTNVLYDAKFTVMFTSPTGRTKNIMGFWDGKRTWKVRFMPDEIGTWKWTSACSDKANKGLDGLSGSFTCKENTNTHAIYRNGAITRRQGLYHLEHADGTPFFWAACTAWNGTLKSTDEEWEYYLDHRKDNNFSVIQFVTTQWRGGDKNSLDQVAFDGSGVINIHPEFFQHLDKKIDRINEKGLVAAPVLLWALATYTGRYLSPGYYLPEAEAILLARYMVARYGAHHVIWILGGDGKYIDEFEQRWKNIGRGVFGDEHPGMVALHPGGKSWLGEVYAQEEWLDIVGYQTGHNHAEATLLWITQGPAAKRWNSIPPKVLINMEPVYEEIRADVTAEDIRNASYWSLLATPTAGITYGANGIWPWLREGELILNHAYKGENTSRWNQSLALPGNVQVGYLAAFFKSIEWWKLKPDPSLLMKQPGAENVKEFISISRSDDGNTIIAYVPSPQEISIRNPSGKQFEAQWFDTVANKATRVSVKLKNGILVVPAPAAHSDHVLVLKVGE